MNSISPIPRIVIVDDDADDHFFLQRALNECGLCSEIRSVFSGLQFLKLLEEGAAPDLIFLDLNMPLLDGYGVLDSMRHRGLLDNISVFVLSTSKSEADRVKSIASGARGYFTKPAVYSDLKTIAGEACAQWWQSRAATVG